MCDINYSVVEISGRQVWLELGKFYDINKIDLNIGDKLNLNCVLLLNKKNKMQFGLPYIEEKTVTATVLNHLSGIKFFIYKMKPKKKMHRKNSFRRKLTRILVDQL